MSTSPETDVSLSHGRLGIEPASVETWMVNELGDISPPLRFDRIAGGNSCLTYLVTDGRGKRLVLRRPPAGELLATAHDVAREYRIIAALRDSGIPVPGVLGLCQDPAVTGAWFYVMDYVDGIVIENSADVERFMPAVTTRHRASEEVVDGLAALHSLETDTVDFGFPKSKTSYLDRQLRRWSAQCEASAVDGIERIAKLHTWLVEHRPGATRPRIVHGDYRLGNVILGPDGSLRAVLDWELCTFGDPLSDLAYLVRSWTSVDARTGPDGTPTLLPGFLTVEELIQRYADRSRRSLDDLPYWMAFTAWRAAAILVGVYKRFADGQMGRPPDNLPAYLQEVHSRVGQGFKCAGLT